MQTSQQKFYNTLISEQQQIGLRYQAVFELKNINTPQAIQLLIQAYPHLSQSVLLSHQVLYTLGQLPSDKISLIKQFLISVVKNEQDNALSRHESAQALANYFLPELETLYNKYLQSDCKELKWTCQIAKEKVKRPELKERYGKLYNGTKEPAAPFTQDQFQEFIKVNKFQDCFKEKRYLGLFLKEQIPLFQKYRIMYLMRNQKTDESKQTLCMLLSKQYFTTQTSLLKHELCFVLGQIGCEGYEHLIRQCIENDEQQPIVRHQALAAVASQSKDAAYLDKFINHPNRLIGESAQVAQFEIHYWND